MFEDLPKNRKDAKIIESLFYFTGNKCKNGHLDKRYTSKGVCKSCSLEQGRRYDSLNKERRSKQRKIERSKDPEKIKKWTKNWRDNNREHTREYSKQYRLKNKHTKEYKYKKAAADSARRARQRKALPKWVDKKHKKRIVEFYKKCPEGHHIDHIIPLTNKNVCGLHVLWNLQYLPASENIRKKNNFRQEDAIAYKIEKC